MHKAINYLYTGKKDHKNKVSSKARVSRWMSKNLENLMPKGN
jgi:hypothetical protein